MTAPGFENEYARPDRPRRSTQGPTVTMVMTGFVGGCVAAALVWLVLPVAALTVAMLTTGFVGGCVAAALVWLAGPSTGNRP